MIIVLSTRLGLKPLEVNLALRPKENSFNLADRQNQSCRSIQKIQTDQKFRKGLKTSWKVF
jgi:hypothetical protein